MRGILHTKQIVFILFPNPTPNPMELMMYLGNDLIESIPVSNEKISQPGYLGSIKRVLKQKHGILIQETGEPPEFLVIDMEPKRV